MGGRRYQPKLNQNQCNRARRRAWNALLTVVEAVRRVCLVLEMQQEERDRGSCVGVCVFERPLDGPPAWGQLRNPNHHHDPSMLPPPPKLLMHGTPLHTRHHPAADEAADVLSGFASASLLHYPGSGLQVGGRKGRSQAGPWVCGTGSFVHHS